MEWEDSLSHTPGKEESTKWEDSLSHDDIRGFLM